MRHARRVLAGAVAVDRALAGGEERFPRNAGGIVDPRLLALGVAAGHLSLFDHGAARLIQPAVDLVQLVFALDLDPQVIEARLFAARRDGEVDARIVEHPFGVVRLHDRGLGREQGRIEADRLRQILDADVDVKTFHHTVSVVWSRAAGAGAQAMGAQGSLPWQLFWVRWARSPRLLWWRPLIAYLTENCCQ